MTIEFKSRTGQEIKVGQVWESWNVRDWGYNVFGEIGVRKCKVIELYMNEWRPMVKLQNIDTGKVTSVEAFFMYPHSRGWKLVKKVRK